MVNVNDTQVSHPELKDSAETNAIKPHTSIQTLEHLRPESVLPVPWKHKPFCSPLILEVLSIQYLDFCGFSELEQTPFHSLPLKHNNITKSYRVH